ncbi:hypothetical protein A3K62_02700 [Candidatus Pacearchaeota archaeon RBG_16_35_8]|nr:MAG: hypothetical protein A3K62_02700 [Candidatus Pacearchaeota archaeon RBG_16_35_8]
MRHYELKPQEKDTYCACSCLQAIFKRHGIEISQQEIAESLNPSKRGFYLDDGRMRRFLESHGFSYKFFFHNETDFNEPDALLEEIRERDGLIGINSHVFLFADFHYPDVKLIDPLHGIVIERDFFGLTREMARNEGFYGLIGRMS